MADRINYPQVSSKTDEWNRTLASLLQIIADTSSSGNQDILDALSGLALEVTADAINLNVQDVENLLKGIGGNEETPSAARVTNSASSVAAGSFGVSISNVGTVNGTVLGAVIKPGETFTYEAKTGNTLGVIVYDSSLNGGTEFVILETR